MKNPLRKRLLRELRQEMGKYLVVFILMVATIGFVSGFLVADGSMLIAYDNSFEKYNIEDGNFATEDKVYKNQQETIEGYGVKLYENFYVEKALSNGSTLRIFKNREEVNKVCLMKGKMPKEIGEIAIDRMYADNNKLSVGDTLKSGKKTWKITGLVALSDYSALFQNNNDTMFDAIKFGVGIVTKEEFSSFNESQLTYDYAWKYNKKPKNEKEEKKRSEDFMEDIGKDITLESFIPQYVNQAIHFTGDDMGSDEAMIIVLLYIVMVIMAFVFGITTSNTIRKEAGVIGTLRASGYTKNELIRHYMSMPVFVTLIGAVVGNILGYTYFKDVMAGMYYGSYSLPTYVTIWSGDAFIKTTIIPFIMMVLINYGILMKSLKLSPLKFMKRDIKKVKKNKQTLVLHRLGFFSQFRLSVILNNLSGYVTLFVGVLFAIILLMFGMDMHPVLDHYQDVVVNNMTAKYQYILNTPESVDTTAIEQAFQTIPQEFRDSFLSLIDDQYDEMYDNYKTKTKGAEAFSLYSLKTLPESTIEEDISLYGLQNNSQYIHIKSLPKKGVYISKDVADKYNLKKGDRISLKESYKDLRYTFEIKGIYDAPGSMALYMSKSYFNEVFNCQDGYFNGYFSNRKITDLKDDYIASTITQDDLTKVSRQLNVSMGEMFYLVEGFAIVMFIMLIYLLTKMIIENNKVSISMVKILGYTSKEIQKMYIHATTIVILISTLLSFGITTWILSYAFKIVFEEYAGWLPFYVEGSVYIKMFIMTVISYLFVMMIQMRKIKKIPMDEALKNVE